MNPSTFFGKLTTAIGLLSRGSLLRTVMNGETDWQQQKRKNRWQKSLVAGKPIIDRLSNGEVIELYPGDFLSNLIYRHQFEMTEQEFVRKFLRPNDVFVDVGANLGLYTLIAAKIVGSKGRVYAFEPAELNFRRLQRNVSLNSFANVNCMKAALSDRDEVRDLTISLEEFGAWDSLAHPSRGDRFETEMVECVTWDRFVDEQSLLGKVTLMKIDVEGWELFVVDGATRTLSEPDSPDLLVEFVDENARNAGWSCDMLYRKLQDLGYEIYQIDAKRGVLIHHQLQETYPYLNLLATKDVGRVLERLQFNLQ